MNIRGLVLVASVALTVAAPVHAATVDYAFDKAGATPDQVVADMEICARNASRVPLNLASIVAPSLIGGLVAGVALGIAEGVQHAHQVSAAADMCMLSLGYTRLPLNESESQAMRAAHGPDAKKAWIRAFVAQDQSARIAEAAANSMVLPQLAPEPFAVGGVRLDPATIKLTDGAQQDGRPLLTVQAAHRRTAVLASDVEGRAVLRLRLKGGATLYAVDAIGSASPEQATLWCGTASVVAFGREKPSGACVFNTDQGGALIPADPDAAWMMSPEDIPAQVRPGSITTGQLALTPADGDTIGPMDVSIEASWINDSGVTLRATATRDGRKVRIWTRKLPFDAQGHAVLPFWSKRLVLARSYDRPADRYFVTASLTEDGDGTGWTDERPVSTVAQSAVAAPPGG